MAWRQLKRDRVVKATGHDVCSGGKARIRNGVVTWRAVRKKGVATTLPTGKGIFGK